MLVRFQSPRLHARRASLVKASVLQTDMLGSIPRASTNPPPVGTVADLISRNRGFDSRTVDE